MWFPCRMRGGCPQQLEVLLRMRILIATDAWHPQINGVVSTYMRLERELSALGVAVGFLTPNDFRTISCPGYREIKLAMPRRSKVRSVLDNFAPDSVHIATEGPIGWAVRAACIARGEPFTTSFHTRFPEYLSALMSIPPSWTYSVVRRFHARSAGVMVATPSLSRELARQGFERLKPWTRGVDTGLFRPRSDRLFGPGPVFLYVGRVSREKNIEAFLAADLPGRKVVVGAGPHREALEARFPAVLFTGPKTGEELARHYASADVFVFPSRTDTFGLVILEAMASGLPVAAYPVTGPVDIIEPGVSGVLSEDLAAAATTALTLDRNAARAHALRYSWQNSALAFLDNIRTARAGHDAVAPAASHAADKSRPLSERPRIRAQKPEFPING